MDYTLPKFDVYRKWINLARERKIDWDTIQNSPMANKTVQEFLDIQAATSFWEITPEDWKQITELQKQNEIKLIDIDFTNGLALIADKNEDNAVTVPEDEHSAWVLYRNKLIKNGFKKEAVDAIQRSTIKILKHLNNDTRNSLPVKGLVVGNVQSGKTANMAALMAMAADWGWNLFIILSGTIENLRQQTQKRLLNDLTVSNGTLTWIGLDKPAPNTIPAQQTQYLQFDDNSKTRYFTVCLKNSSRLHDLIEWLQKDPNKQQQMKILVIDDESDQAGINTAKIDNIERTRISKRICSLVNGWNSDGDKIDIKYRAMNYIGYTATPYANVLNESGEESLYPRNFISTLSVSKEYFGPQQIFGVDGGDYDGLDIVRIIDTDDDKTELEAIKALHQGDTELPRTLEDSIAWFLCGVSCMRIWEKNKPVSLLVHTSQKTNHHNNVAEAIKDWFKNNTKTEIIAKCKAVWKRETKRFTIEKFREQYFDYGIADDDISKYPDFNLIEKQIGLLLDSGLTNIHLDDKKEFEYSKGIHLCVDNCKNNGATDDNFYIRLAYPEDKLDYAAAFIVVGGATLSRGLTIEGLISTYFVRSSGQADTLMQMGRWFGYRKGYELLPRIWISTKTNEQFKYLSNMDQELRDEIYDMDIRGTKPTECGPRIMNTPSTSFIRITAKNRMQSAQPTDWNFTGTFKQTFMFKNDVNIIKNNNKYVLDFIDSLGSPADKSPVNKHSEDNLIWKNIDFNLIKPLFMNYDFHQRLDVFNNIQAVVSWIEEITAKKLLGNWNVIIGSKKDAKAEPWNLSCGTVSKVTRTRKLEEPDNYTINIGALSAPNDLIADIDLELHPELTEKVLHYKSSPQSEGKKSKELRAAAGLDKTPQLIIYCIDHNSKSTKTTRKDLGITEDIIGLCINIPGDIGNKDYTATVSIKLEPIDDGDLGGTNAD